MLGRGGMSVVYLVLDQETGERVALKTLLPKFREHRMALHRFVREVKAIRKLDHPCIVKIFDTAESDKLMYFTMEYVRGKSLRHMLSKRGKLGFGSTVRIVSLVCSALQQVHKVTIHRDLSPENVMVQASGDLKLLDFGLAKMDHQDTSTITHVGVRLGKEEYCSPEQLEDAKNVDHRADLFSVGVMFYEMLAGCLPLPRKRITDYTPELPLQVNAFAEKAMAEDPDERFASARVMRRVLRAIFDSSENPDGIVTGPDVENILSTELGPRQESDLEPG